MRLALLLALLFAGATVAASNDAEAIDARAHALAQQVRCVVCQNQTLADSNAPLANDLRREIHVQLQAGASDAAIKDYLVQRYGDFVLYEPPLQSRTVLLWFGPFALLAAVALSLWWRRRAAAAPTPEPLDADARNRVDELLQAGDGAAPSRVHRSLREKPPS